MINYYSYSNTQYLCQGNTVTNLSTLNFMNNHTSSLKLIELTTSFGWGQLDLGTVIRDLTREQFSLVLLDSKNLKVSYTLLAALGALKYSQSKKA